MPLDRKPKIVVIGSANMDLVVKTERIPELGQTVLGGTFFQLPGGKGANQAVAAARLGADVTFIGCVGADAFGDQLAAGLKADGIDCSFLRRVEDTASGVALIGVDEAGRNSIIVAPGANSKLCFQDIDAAKDAISVADIVVAQLEVPLDLVDYAFDVASDFGVRTILNPAPFRPGGMLPPTMSVNVLVPNEHEAAAIANLSPEESFEPEDIEERLNTWGFVVMTLGEQGSIVFGSKTTTRIPALPVKVVDTTAAGDCFIGALAVGLAEGMTLEDAARFATKAAAISVTRLGAQPSLPWRREIEDAHRIVEDLHANG